jgi:L-Ala-D/L-Glu epimerase
MKMNFFPVYLPLHHPFTISRGTMTTASSLYVQLEHEGISGFGEVTENPYYGHTFDSITASLEKARPYLDRYVDENPLEIWEQMAGIVDNDMFALSALDIAAHDFRGKKLGVPCWQDWGLEWNDVVPSSYTIGIDSIDKMIAKLAEQPDWPVYKIKLGTSNDLEMIQALRRQTSATFRVDANCAWTADQAIEKSKALADLGVEFIEQPLTPDTPLIDKQKLFEKSALPIIADEDCQVIFDVAKCEGIYHGINVKICKCGGLSPALKMLKQARELKMKTMVGCMIESSVAISGAAQLLPLLDYADLDGAFLLDSEPAIGVRLPNGHIEKPTAAGCGSEIKFDQLNEFQMATLS